jgi:hypothetical protein
MRQRTLLLLVGLVLGAGLIAAGCGDDDSTTGSTSGGISEDEQAALVDGCQTAIDSSPQLSSADADSLISECEDAAASSSSLEEASQRICVVTAKTVAGDALSDKQAEAGCKDQLP